MKRASTKKVKVHPVDVTGNQCYVKIIESVHLGLKPQVRTSVLMSGLVLSLGVFGVLSTGQSDRRAVAAEPGDNSTINQVSASATANSITNSNGQVEEPNNSTDTSTNKLAQPSLQNLQTEIQRLREQYPDGQPSSQVTPAGNNGTQTMLQQPQTNPTATPTAPKPLATAPMDVDFSGSLDLGKGKLVSPELPPLAAGDLYLPKPLGVFKGYIWPTKGVLTSPFGWRWGHIHPGIDIAAPIGTPIFAAAPGVVVVAGWTSGGYGNLVQIRHPDGSFTRYGHNSRVLVHPGEIVTQGQEIAEMGSTGFSTGSHCHFEVHPLGHGAVNPIAYLPR